MPCGKCGIRCDRHFVLARDRQKLPLVLAVNQVVVWLQDGELCPAVLFGYGLHVLELVAEHLARPQRADFPGLDEAVQGFHRLLNRMLVVKAVDVVNVEVVGAEPSECSVDFAVDCFLAKLSLVEVDLCLQARPFRAECRAS